MLQTILLLIVILFLFYKILREQNYLVNFHETKNKIIKKYNDFIDYLWLSRNIHENGVHISIYE